MRTGKALLGTLVGLLLVGGGAILVAKLPSAAAATDMTKTSDASAAVANASSARLFTTPADLSGAKMYFEDSVFTIEELVWGIANDGTIQPYVMRGTLEDGQRYERVAELKDFTRLVAGPDDFRGAWYGDARSDYRFKIEELRLVVSSDSFIKVQFSQGIDTVGSSVSIGSAMGAVCCQVNIVHKCTTGGCSVACTGIAPCRCAGSGSCGVALLAVCRGGCAPGNPCKESGNCNGNVFDCHCL